jgi:hypothetical protein
MAFIPLVTRIHHRGSCMKLIDDGWLCKCECGNDRVYGSWLLRQGKVKSCGCKRGELTRQLKTKHGCAVDGSVTTEYRIWLGMHNRCNNPHTSKFKHYGGRGIRVCEQWKDFSVFLRDMGPRPEGMSIDRIDVDGHYEPSNCRWATAKTQAQNKRRSITSGSVNT